MKTISTLTIVAALSLSWALAQEDGHGHDHDSHDHEEHQMEASEASGSQKAVIIEAAAGRTATVIVKGMVCDFCAQSLTKVLKRKDAVEDVAISLEEKTVTIRFIEGGMLTDDEIEEAVLNAGYNLASIERG